MSTTDGGMSGTSTPDTGPPVDGDDSRDPVRTFKDDLNAFRQSCPNSSFGALEVTLKRNYPHLIVGKTALNDATRPDRLIPSARTVEAMVTALTGGDATAVAEWLTRRTAAVGGNEVDEEIEAGDVQRPPPRRGRWWVVAGVVVLLVGSNTLTYTLATRSANPPGPLTVTSGDDPQQCAGDATLANPQVTLPTMMVLKILFSPGCSAVWGKVERLDSAGHGDTITVTVYRDLPRALTDPALHFTVTETNTGNAYTPMIVRSSPAERICVTASMTVDNGGTHHRRAGTSIHMTTRVAAIAALRSHRRRRDGVWVRLGSRPHHGISVVVDRCCP